ncbi:cold shock domain-containing protein [Candidatus Dojkabacteria bacterium]|nr:cold shock domain-containing protein [Candidatus Dojkabacteria bacterium]
MAKGTVKTVTGRGFGFIETEEAEKDVFYHENSLEGELAVRKLRKGDVVTFDIEETEKGLNAINIELVDEE